jgi:hypothetical protein
MSDDPYGFPIFNRIHAQADLMDRMMERTGANPLLAIRRDGSASWCEARSRCVDCAADRQCRDWLDAGPSNGPQGAPAFCANSDFINACREDAPESSAAPLASPATPKD